jgi:hypothetical protein
MELAPASRALGLGLLCSEACLEHRVVSSVSLRSNALTPFSCRDGSLRDTPLPPTGDADPDDFGDDARGEASQGESLPESPVGRLRAHRHYWLATMHQIQ